VKSLSAILPALALCAGTAYGGFFPDNAFTDDARGLAGAQFLKVPPSARFSALGGAGLTLGGADAFFLNPAGAAAAGRDGRAASVSYEALLEGASRTGLAFSNGTASGVFSAGLLYNGASPGEKLDGAGSGAGDSVPAYDAAFGAGWARGFGSFDFGVNLKYLRSRLADQSGASAALDAGFVFREAVPSRTELALTLRNFGPPLKLGSEKDPLPFELGGGLRWKYTPDFNIFMEGRMPCDHAPYLAFAGEWFLPYAQASGLFLRAGLNFKNYGDHGFMGAFAGGFGLKFGGLLLDYAFAPYGELGAAHRMTAGWAWGGAAAASHPVKPVPLPARSATLAVAAFSAEAGVTETEAAVLRNLTESELVKTGRFRLVERSKLDFILAEKKLAYAGLSDDKAAAQLARLSGADLAVFGIVARNKKGYSVTARLVDGASGEILRSADAVAAEDYLFRDAARRLAASLSSR
jgi:TolB-like protein